MTRMNKKQVLIGLALLGAMLPPVEARAQALSSYTAYPETMPPVGASDRSGRSEAPAFLSGVVTGKVRSGIRINDRTYAFHSRATLTDEEGEDVDRNQLVRGVQVKFHLRRGKIDQIIVFLPR